jgi:hypothetical protein
MADIFPKITRCTMFKVGPSGSLENKEGLCLLPINVLNEKIYVFIWFWFSFMTVISTLNMVYRFVVVLCPPLQLEIIASKV